MSVKTDNIYGRIVISDHTIEKFISRVTVESYGIVRFVCKNAFDSIVNFFSFKSGSKGVKVRTKGDRIGIEVSVIVKYGVSIGAVTESLKETIKYKTERFTGMIVDYIDVNVIGVER